jgi:decaprenylphospho-beta-D-ribofuranose 2-oxidase
VTAVESAAFDRILEFDPSAGIITVEPGLSVGELVHFLEPRGWCLPVVPGHPRITVGGCVGFDVHGKGHLRRGTFGDSVRSLRVLTPDGDEVDCAPGENAELFRATLGGFGLTGFVTAARIALEPLRGRSVERQRVAVGGLEEAVELMREAAAGSDALFSWHDFNAPARSFGRGFVYIDRPSPEAVGRGGPSGPSALSADRPRRAPGTLLPRWLTPLFTGLYRTLEGRRPERQSLPLWQATFPISGRELYFQLLGRRGFREYQALVPWDAWPEAARSFQEVVRASAVRPTLGSLKVLAGRPGHLRFAGDGVCITLDAPADDRTLSLFRRLDDWVAEVGGLVNLSKDGRLSAETVRRVFPEWSGFAALIQRFDPGRKLQSSLRRRVLADV